MSSSISTWPSAVPSVGTHFDFALCTSERCRPARHRLPHVRKYLPTWTSLSTIPSAVAHLPCRLGISPFGKSLPIYTSPSCSPECRRHQWDFAFRSSTHRRPFRLNLLPFRMPSPTWTSSFVHPSENHRPSRFCLLRVCPSLPISTLLYAASSVDVHISSGFRISPFGAPLPIIISPSAFSPPALLHPDRPWRPPRCRS